MSVIDGPAGALRNAATPPYCVSACAVGALSASAAVAMINNPVRWSLTVRLGTHFSHEHATGAGARRRRRLVVVAPAAPGLARAVRLGTAGHKRCRRQRR